VIECRPNADHEFGRGAPSQIKKTSVSSLASLKKHGSPNTIEHQLASGWGCQRNTVSPAVLEQSLGCKTPRTDATPSICIRIGNVATTKLVVVAAQ
jgi:hypothetical protein